MLSARKPIPKKSHWNKQRLCDMFFHGASDAELSECLKKKKLQLTAAKVRVGNVPPTHLGKAKFVADLSDEAMEHIKEWFYVNGNFSGLLTVAEACQRLAPNPSRGAAPLAKTETHTLWRSVLQAFSGNTEKKLVESLLSQEQEALAQPAAPAVPAAITLSDADASDSLLLASGRGQVSSMARPGVAIIAGLVAAARHDGVAYGAAKQKLLDQGTPLATRFGNLLDAVYKQSFQQAAPPDSRLAKPALGLLEVDLNDRAQIMVIGGLQRVLDNGTFFVHIQGIIQDGNVIELASDEAREIFLENGDAIAFPNTPGLAPPNDYSLGVWHVVHLNTDKSAHYNVTRYERHVYDVVDVPHMPDQPDKVRLWIQQSYQAHKDVRPLFRLTDGTIIRLPRDTGDPAHSDFDAPLNAYNDLPLWHFHNRVVFAGVFPTPDFRFDCAPAHVLVKRLFRAKSSLASLSHVTKAQINDLAALATTEATDEALRNSLERAKGKVAALSDDKEAVDAVIDDILNLPTVKAQVEEERQRLAGELIGQAAEAKLELTKLQNEKMQLQSELKNIKAAIEREAATLASEVKKAFDAASAEGMKTLGQVAVISRALGVGSSGRQPGGPTGMHDTAAETPVIFPPGGLPVGSATHLNAAIAQWALRTGLSNKLLHSAIAASTTGVIALAGPRQEEVYEFLVGTVSGGVACEVSVSGDMFSVSDVLNAPAVVRDGKQAYAMPLGEFLSNPGSRLAGRIIHLRGINRMPPESLLPELFAIWRSHPESRQLAWTDKRGATRLLQLPTPTVFVLDFVQGRSVFPCYPPTSLALPVVDTSAPWGDQGDAEPEMPMRCAYIDPKYYLGSLAPSTVGSTPAVLNTLPHEALAVATRLYTAACATGMAAGDAITFVIAALGVGRIPRDKLPPSPASAEQAWQQYFNDADTLFGQAFFEKDAAK
ncbi:MAG TPA: hypothetical protein VJ577_20120 [Burkholderiaceae bacterium]|nr:hypothetical protein [Burkholderiaceae bacterium]